MNDNDLRILAKCIEAGLLRAGSIICHKCGGHMAHGTKPVEFEYKGNKITLEQPGWYCPGCEESVLTGADMMATEPAFLEFKDGVESRIRKSDDAQSI